MELLISTDEALANIAVIRHILAEMGGSEVATLSITNGAGMLLWSHEDGTHQRAHIAIPRSWLTDPDKVGRLKEATQHFAASVRFAAKR